MFKKMQLCLFINLFLVHAEHSMMAMLQKACDPSLIDAVSIEKQACAPLIDQYGIVDLDTVKKQLLNMQRQEVVFDVLQDASSDTFFKRKGLLVRRNHALGTVLMCHGYLGCKRDAIALKHLFPSYNVLAFDFRAHGELTDGQKSTIGKDEALDVMGAVRFIKSDEAMKNKPIFVYGYSMGAVAAIEAQSQDSTLFDAMILDCPFDSTDDAMNRGLEEAMKVSLFGNQVTIPGKQFILDHMYDDNAQMITNYLFKQITSLDSNRVATKFVKVSPVESIKKITVPCLFIHCDKDKKVPVLALEQLFKNKPGFKQLWITLGKGHFGSYNNDPELYWYKVNKFLSLVTGENIDELVQEKVYDHRLPL